MGKRAKYLIDGFKIKEDAIPIKSTECDFGKWFYGDCQDLCVLQNNPQESIDNIEKLHFKVHDIYYNIFRIYYGKENRSYLRKVFGKHKKVTNEEIVLGKEHYQELESVSKELIEALTVMEKRIRVVSDEDIKAL